jgi:two-component system C4-dicarboxylate transport sensor histidine kinase DctB
MIQVVVALLNNAIEAIQSGTGKNGKREIIISYGQNGSTPFISVEDSGGGIENQYREKIFEPYFTTKSKKNGVGIGLYMSKMIVEENMQGHLRVENTNLGAKFTITL